MQTTQNGSTPAGSGIGVFAALDAFLRRRAAGGARPNTVAAYRRDIEGVLAELFAADDAPPATQPIEALSAEAFIGAFKRWAERHRPSSVRRAWSAWNAFWADLLDHGLRPHSPMSFVARPDAPEMKAPATMPVTAWQLQAIAASVDPRSRHPWPERDAALVGLLLGTGVRLGELDDLCIGSVSATRPAAVRILDIEGTPRTVPIDDDVLETIHRYLDSRRRRFPHDHVDDPDAPLLVDHEGHPLARHQAQYLVRRLFERAGVDGELRRGTATTVLRNAYASRVAHEGVDADELRRRLGERSMATVRRHSGDVPLKLEPSSLRARALAEQGMRLHHQREDIARRMEALAERIRAFQTFSPPGEGPPPAD